MSGKAIKKIRKWYRKELNTEAVQRNNELWTQLMGAAIDSRRRWTKLAILFFFALLVSVAVNIKFLLEQ